MPPSPVIPVTRRRLAPFQTTEEENGSSRQIVLNSPGSLCTPSRASAAPRATAAWDSQVRDSRANVSSSNSISSKTFFTDRRENTSSSSQLNAILALAKIENESPGRISREISQKFSRHDNFLDRNATDMRTSTKSVASFNNAISIPSGKPMRRSSHLGEVNYAQENRMPNPSNISRLVDRSNGNLWASGSSVSTTNTAYGRDRAKDHIPSATLDLPSPYMCVSDDKSAQTIPYETAHDSGKSKESRQSNEKCRQLDTLDDEEFRLVFEMSREQWNMLPSWQKEREKKLLELF